MLEAKPPPRLEILHLVDILPPPGYTPSVINYLTPREPSTKALATVDRLPAYFFI